MNELKKEIGERLAKIRKSKNMRQDQLKDLIGAPTVQMISSWECGHSFPSTTYLILIAKKLDISLDYLLLGKENDSNHYKMNNYKDICGFIVELLNNDMFKISGYFSNFDSYITELNTSDETIYRFKNDFENLQVSKKIMRKDLYDEAVNDLLEKFDIPLKDKKTKK